MYEVLLASSNLLVVLHPSFQEIPEMSFMIRGPVGSVKVVAQTLVWSTRR